ncbi:MAG TPA: SAM-dependent methyltransferase [Chloroflexota bacterium]|nr:SAM-dependent methyltransferase [Chloroflexota bacterium]
MAQSLPSGVGWTALLVARARTNESRRADRLFEDPLAKAFVAAGGQALAEAGLPGGRQEEVNRWREDSVALRTRFLDGVVTSALMAGCRQVALVAAGLDTRAFRLDWPAGVRLFELDMADVFEFKERVLQEHDAEARCERHIVAADLRDAGWPDALRAAGFTPDQPAVWLVEGLLMYLAEEDRDGLMRKIAELAAPDSWLGLDHRPGFFAVPQLPGTSAGHLPPEKVDDPSLTNPAGWLAGHGWRAQVHQAAELFQAGNRPLPPSLQPAASGAPLSWLASAVRV